MSTDINERRDELMFDTLVNDGTAATMPTSIPRSIPHPLEENDSLEGIFDQYTVVDELTTTTQSRVYRGKNKEGEQVVIKEFLQNHRSRAFEREKFADELFLKRGQHSQIIPAQEFFIKNGGHYGIFPYVEGKNLQEVLIKEGFLTEKEILPLVSTLCDVVDYLHSLNLIHRDIKPANIIIPQSASDLTPKVFDFGLAWHPDIAHLDKPETYYSTPSYMAPEKWKLPPTNPQEDIYAIVVTAFELLYGTVPFPVDNIHELAIIHAAKIPIPDLTQCNPWVPDEVRAVIYKGLSYDPTQRYQTAGEFKTAYLEAVGKK